jgi:5-methylcytosine-specific restriction endonuclease McrA
MSSPLLQLVSDALKGKPLSRPRSSKWSKVRNNLVVEKVVCAVCGGGEKLEVHHIKPFHLHPELELEPSNLIVLCESNKGGMNCHLAVGHLGSYKSFNVDVITDSATWKKKIESRPSVVV